MDKRKLIKPLFSLLLVCALMLPTMATPLLADSSYPLQPGDPVIVKALDYLQSIQAADGSIGSYSDSAWAVMAIAAAGQNPHEWGNPSVVAYLKNNASLISGEFNLGTAYARMVLSIIAADADPSSFGPGDPTYAPGGDYLSKLKELHNGTQFTDGFGNTDTLNDDFWGIMALIASREPRDSALITSTVAFIKDNQAEDGGWSWATPANPWYGESDVDSTAAAIMALRAAGEHPGSVAIANGIAYMKDNQDISGGFFSWGAVSLASTIQSVDAIKSTGGDPSGTTWIPYITSPVNFVLGMQEEQGSFFDPGAWMPMREKNSSDAIVALLGKPYPVGYMPLYSVGGEAYPVNKSTILIPWIAAGMALAAAVVLALRRRTARR